MIIIISQQNQIALSKTEYASLENTLSGQGRKLHTIVGDGNCLFRALAYIIWGTQSMHKNMVTHSEICATSCQALSAISNVKLWP